MNRGWSFDCLLLLTLAGSLPAAVRWNAVLSQPDAWYGSDEARIVAANVLLHQDTSGGWPKNRDMTQPPTPGLLTDHETDLPTIDNGATWTQVRLLARVNAARPDVRWHDALLRGVDYMLAAQYSNGGWPQFHPRRKGYYTHITFNDDAMIGVMRVLRDIVANHPEYSFVDDARRQRAADAVRRGIDCILRCQVVVKGHKTVWCAQHDEQTFAPAPARKFEPVSLSGLESVGITRFLMGIDEPTDAEKQAVEAAIAWFKAVQVSGIRLEFPETPKLPRGHDCVVVADPAAPPLWARFYEIETNRPIFSGRDSVIRYSLAEIEAERRTGYHWYTDAPRKLLERDYPRWRQRLDLP